MPISSHQRVPNPDSRTAQLSPRRTAENRVGSRRSGGGNNAKSQTAGMANRSYFLQRLKIALTQKFLCYFWKWRKTTTCLPLPSLLLRLPSSFAAVCLKLTLQQPPWPQPPCLPRKASLSLLGGSETEKAALLLSLSAGLLSVQLNLVAGGGGCGLARLTDVTLDRAVFPSGHRRRGVQG